jgi:SAM-dependent methyltransferase
MTPNELWLSAMWPFVRDHLPSPPARVLEIGCGPVGGFVPALGRDGYQAVGVDPEAPEAPGYHRIEFERYAPPEPVHGVVACTSLHHVHDLDEVADRVSETLLPGGTLVVVEWAWERFDEATARWCFARLGPTALASEPGWLHRRRDEWVASGQPWHAYWQEWAQTTHLHPGREILATLDARFDRVVGAEGPYFFPELDDIAEQTEQAAIDAAQVQASCILYVGVVGS